MEKVTRYMALDGTEFNTEQECQQYEQGLQVQMNVITRWLNYPKNEPVYAFFEQEFNHQNKLFNYLKRLDLKDQHGNTYFWVPKSPFEIEIYVFDGTDEDGNPEIDLFDTVGLYDFLDMIDSEQNGYYPVRLVQDEEGVEYMNLLH